MTDIVPARYSQLRGRDPYADTEVEWYGDDPVFRILVERNMAGIAGFEAPVGIRSTPGELSYAFRQLQVPGDLVRHDLKVVFRAGPMPDWGLGIAACDYPSVFTNVERPRKHLHADGGLCLWASFDPPARRWWHGDGLLPLVELARRHLFFELHWWRTGGHRDGEWLGDEAPHGYPTQRDRA